MGWRKVHREVRSEGRMKRWMLMAAHEISVRFERDELLTERAIASIVSRHFSNRGLDANEERLKRLEARKNHGHEEEVEQAEVSRS